ncbi:MAG: ABC transporter substrate-binding protein [Hyphomicrobiales bacterium]|nr:ABC transporter substrate-binding protein [Hyphomicrobiales bacterium]
MRHLVGGASVPPARVFLCCRERHLLLIMLPMMHSSNPSGWRVFIAARAAMLMVAAVLLAPTGQTMQAAEPAEKTVAAMLGQIDWLSASGLSEAEMARRFLAIESQYLDRTAMAREALGTYGAKLTGTALADYVNAYRTYLADSFVFGVRKTGASTSRVLGSRKGPDGVAVVISRIRTGKKVRDTLWFFCADRERICDVEVDGARASARQRKLFTEILHERGLRALVRDLKSGVLVSAA